MGIEGNERADQLAAAECASPSTSKIEIRLSSDELIAIFRKVWCQSVLSQLKSTLKDSILMKCRLAITP